MKQRVKPPDSLEKSDMHWKCDLIKFQKSVKEKGPSQSPTVSSELPVFKIAQLSFDKFLPNRLDREMSAFCCDGL